MISRYRYDVSPRYTYQFTGKERDSETGLDYFGARYYGNTVGRWTSPDWAETPKTVPYLDQSDPRTLNLYSYVRNNPVWLPDIDRHEDGLIKDFLNVVEVEVDAGVGVKASAQAGTVEYKVEALRVGVELKSGLGGGNAEAKDVAKLFEFGAQSGPVEGKIKAGAELSTVDGAKVEASANGRIGPVQGSVSINHDGNVDKSLTLAGNKDVKVGATLQGMIGIGVKINFSQLGRALSSTRESLNLFGQYLVQEMQKSVPDRDLL
ncbi:MAG TPA: RHS repeat-associated core domain-containing protein [Terriglobales bacterium]|nr:RHS repeat-associated core domain-containing protein [Terriglobales bacterium]